MKSKCFSVRHPMEEFGTVSGVTRQVRVNRLEKRLIPLVPFPHRHSFYHLLFIHSGTGWHEIDFERYSLRPSQIFLMKPGQVHSWRLNRETKGYVIEFGREVFKQHYPEVVLDKNSLDQIPDQFQLPPDSINRIQTLLSLMISEYEQQNNDFETILKLYLFALLIELNRITSSSGFIKRKKEIFVDHFLSLLEENFQCEHSVSYYAKLLNVTPKALTMRIARALGKSARTIIQERCLLESKRLLAYSDLSISEIGYQLGFEDPNYFSRFFRGLTHTNPSDFRIKTKRVLN